MKFNTTQLAPDLWAIDEGMVRCFLLHGSRGTLLIDACMSGGEEFLEAVKAVTGGAEVTYTMTHSDHDHTGGFTAENTVLVHPAEYEHLGEHAYSVAPLWEGGVIEAGERTLKPLLLPGHTPGNMAFVDEAAKKIFIGDTISMGSVFMFGNGRCLPAYITSLERLTAEYADYTYYPCHGDVDVPAAQLTAQLECAVKVLAGEVEGVEPGRPMPCKLYNYGGAGLLY
jgi:glyoxylase-like metal-dependent hydrolase (beta-lactamase superfamily II)